LAYSEFHFLCHFAST